MLSSFLLVQLMLACALKSHMRDLTVLILIPAGLAQDSQLSVEPNSQATPSNVNRLGSYRTCTAPHSQLQTSRFTQGFPHFHHSSLLQFYFCNLVSGIVKLCTPPNIQISHFFVASAGIGQHWPIHPLPQWLQTVAQ